MLSIKNELLSTLAAELEKLQPGAGAKATFESPKVAAHGDYACTAAMQLAKPLKANPRQLAQTLVEALQSTAKGQGFAIHRSVVELTGLCAACQEAP